MRLGIIGLGTQGTKLATAAANMGSRIAALCDLDPLRLEAARTLAPDARQVARIEDLAGLDLDVAIVATLADSHELLIESLAEIGIRRILCEKPIVGSMAALSAFRDRLDRGDVCVAVNHIFLFGPENDRIRELIASGILGSLTSAQAHFKRKGFGNMGVHALSRALYLTGAEIASAEEAAFDDGEVFMRSSGYWDPNGWARFALVGGAPLTAMNLPARPPGTSRIVLQFERGRIDVNESANLWSVFDHAQKCESCYSFEYPWSGSGTSPDTMCFLLDEAISDLLAGDTRKVASACSAVEAVIAAQLSQVRGQRVSLPLDAIDTPYPFS